MNIKSLNKECVKMANRYAKLNIHNKKIPTPYYINSIQGHFSEIFNMVGIPSEKIIEIWRIYKSNKFPYGRYRGKGTPEEIEDAVIKVSTAVGLPLDNSSIEVILNFMKLYGLGVDCSGYVYNLLSSAFKKIEGSDQQLKASLNWMAKSKRDVWNAGAFAFAGKASVLVTPERLQPLDLILLKDKDQKYVHVALVIKHNGKLLITQSQICMNPSGVRSDNAVALQPEPLFDYHPEIGPSWEDLYKKGRLEFRRLKILA